MLLFNNDALTMPGIKKKMNDYSSLISSVVHLMSDKNPEVVQYATDAIIEMGRPAATKVCKSIITDINSYSSSVPTNRKVLINAIKETP